MLLRDVLISEFLDACQDRPQKRNHSMSSAHTYTHHDTTHVQNTSCHTQKLYAEGGVGRFYRGYTPCMIRAMPANAAMLFTVEVVTNALNS